MSVFLKFILITLSASFLTIYCNSQNKSIDTSKQQATISLYKFLSRDTSSRSINWTIDYDGLFTAQERKTLDSIISDFEQKTTIEICIATIDSAMTTGENFDDFVLQIHNTWGVGKKGKDNGIVIGISSRYRKIRISNGYEIEKILSDNETKHIIDNNFIPFFKKADFFEGTLNGLKAIITKLKENMSAVSR